MKLRWVGGRSYLVEFTADEQSIATNAAIALERFQLDNPKRYRDGSTHRDVIEIREAKLQVEINGVWRNSGCMVMQNGKPHFFQACFCVESKRIENSESSILDHLDQQRFMLFANSKQIMQGILGMHSVMARLTNFIHDIGSLL